MPTFLTRRRLIRITAAAAGVAALPLGRAETAAAGPVTWRGQAMGAVASLRLHHPDPAAANDLVRQALAEIRRIERVFSLYRDDSALVELNRRGKLHVPPPELVALLGECRRYFELSGGAFDPSVQALWELYVGHFSRTDPDPEGPSADALRAVLARVGFAHVLFDPHRVVLRRPGMALTLNGIAQGYATDRVVELLRAGGIERCLVDLGEIRGTTGPDDDPWLVGIADPRAPGEVAGDPVEIADRAVATSGAYGFSFDSAGRFNHLFDPRTGGCAHLYRSLTVIAPTAVAADALSTACSLLPPEAVESILRRVGDAEARLVTAGGDRIALPVAPSSP